MGVVAKIKQFSRRVRNGITVGEALVNPDGVGLVTADHYAPPGDDSQPILGDFVLGVRTPQAGSVAIAGYVDSNNAPVTSAGEKRIYARDPSTGNVVGSLYLKADGSAEIVTSGTVTINGVTIETDGTVTIPSSLTLGGKEIAGHVHGGVQSGGSNTGPNT